MTGRYPPKSMSCFSLSFGSVTISVGLAIMSVSVSNVYCFVGVYTVMYTLLSSDLDDGTLLPQYDTANIGSQMSPDDHTTYVVSGLSRLMLRCVPFLAILSANTPRYPMPFTEQSVAIWMSTSALFSTSKMWFSRSTLTRDSSSSPSSGPLAAVVPRCTYRMLLPRKYPTMSRVVEYA